MLSQIWNAVLYKPMVNILALFVAIIPGGNVGVAVVILTLLVKTALFPLSQKSIENQAKMNKINPELQKIKQSGASKEEQAKKTMELYKEHGANPFSGCLLVLIQIPIIFALYYAFIKGIKFDQGLLYSFTPVPGNVNMHFLGMDLAGKSLILAILAGISQFLQAYFMPQPPKNTSAKPGSFTESFSKSMQMQMKYVFPFIVAFIAYSVSGAVALYWLVSNLFAVGQQLYLYKKKDLIPPYRFFKRS